MWALRLVHSATGPVRQDCAFRRAARGKPSGPIPVRDPKLQSVAEQLAPQTRHRAPAGAEGRIVTEHQQQMLASLTAAVHSPENKCPLVDRSGVSADQSPKGALQTGLCLQSNRSPPRRKGN